MSQDTDATEPAEAEGELIPRLRVIEQQPLSERATAYAALHDELARHLESGPTG
ncbi:MAG TPA: hypothetical protein VJR25_04670 [Microbacterium sp.]|uniref:hypothetical protein n=1 Tax=Microbacterium sp. TaxID=51671 RepID=UPI002B48897E|nr:hypothetical protein [Microbacterium sp.]HKT56045.1 hypothetical protein [Microbacterium sp.]